MNDTYYKMISEYEKIAKHIMIYNAFCSGNLYNCLTEEKMNENIIGTYKNIYNYGFENDDSSLIDNIDKYLRKIIRLFNEYDVSSELDIIKEKYISNKRKTFYVAFCFFSEGVELLAKTNNMLYNFIINICDVDFINLIKNDMILLDSFLFIQRLIRLIRDVIYLHWKKIKICKLRLMI